MRVASAASRWRSISAIWPRWPPSQKPWSSAWHCPALVISRSPSNSTKACFRSHTEFDVAIAGGDTNSWNGPLVISITAFGTLTSRGPLLRSQGKPGDAILVTGDFGGSILGKHLDFTPRVREALRLNERYELHAAMDVSDGLSLDLSRPCRSSRCGAELFLDRIPIAAAAAALAISRRAALPQDAALDHALSDGEDFELILTTTAAESEKLLRDQPLGAVRLTEIGRLVPDRGLFAVDAQGRRTPLTPRGYEH